MIDTGLAGVTGHNETMDMVKLGGTFFNEDVISKKDFFDAVIFTHDGLLLQAREETHILKKSRLYSAPGCNITVRNNQKVLD